MLYISGSSGAQFDERARHMHSSGSLIGNILMATSADQLIRDQG
jgi:hypothetical protein